MNETPPTLIETLKEATGELLSDETLNSLEQAFNESVDSKVGERVNLHVEKALVEQDEDHAAKLESLLEALDTDHTTKLNKVILAINENHAHKLKQVVSKYSTDVVEEASSFKADLVNKISNYLNLYIENTIPVEDIQEAVKNKKAAQQLTEMRKFLAVNFALSKDSIKDAIVDGKKQIQESKVESSKLVQENSDLKADLEASQRKALLSEKTRGLPTVKQSYITRVLGDKPLDFIEENFEYTLNMFEKTEEERVMEAKQAASRKRVAVDRPVQVRREPVLESASVTNADSDPLGYMSELSKF
jgi:hypothetical protein